MQPDTAITLAKKESQDRKYDHIYLSRQLTERYVRTTDRLGRMTFRRHSRDDDAYDDDVRRHYRRERNDDSNGGDGRRHYRRGGNDDGNGGDSRRHYRRGHNDDGDGGDSHRHFRHGRDKDDEEEEDGKEDGKEQDGEEEVRDSCRPHRYERSLQQAQPPQGWQKREQ